MINERQILELIDTDKYLSNCFFWMNEAIKANDATAYEKARIIAIKHLNKIGKILNAQPPNASESTEYYRHPLDDLNLTLRKGI